MKNKNFYLILMIILVVFSLYWFDCINVMADDGKADEKMKTETVSTGAELMEWMESHKNTGGRVKLLDNITLEEDYDYCYCPKEKSTPPVFIDVNNHTITVTGRIELFSDNQLIFQGEAEGKKDIFRVKKGGMLSLYGITIENGQPHMSYTLWQEEGAGLVLEKCRISGKIHYANTPFVMYYESACVILEGDQTAASKLPTEIRGSVNRSGQVSNEEIPVFWNLSGTEKEQENRLRFLVEGSFIDAACADPPICTVVYNDYLLTFMEVDGFVSKNLYYFKGSYVKSEDHLPMEVTYEYSFDEKNWMTYDKTTASKIIEGFFIGVLFDEWDTEKHPYLYLRLSGIYNETRYCSNVLKYTSDNLKIVEDQGGNRGGGTSIVNPPNEPQKTSDSVSFDFSSEKLPVPEQENSDEKSSDIKEINEDITTKSESEIINTETDTVHSAIVNSEGIDHDENKVLPKVIVENNNQKITSIDQNPVHYEKAINYDFAPAVVNEKSLEQPLEPSLSSVNVEEKQETHEGRAAMAVSGIVFSSVLVGSAGYCFHAGIFQRVLQIWRKFL